ncbi:MAG TPA: DapH/DapD/GlmU-related protein [Myxococcales bacterium]|nr:DapH/DapD/GlmU-related protein [Myxococcales bacterium]
MSNLAPTSAHGGDEEIATGTGTRIARVLRTEIGSLHPRLSLAQLAVRALPQLAFPYLRTALYRLAGISIGRRSLVAGRLDLIGTGRIERRLRIGEDCWINAPFFADLTDQITLGDHVTIGHHVVLVTADHEEGPSAHRAGAVDPAPIVIGNGCWIASRVTILPGVTIGDGSIVGAGSLVTRDVPPDTLAVGVPARPLRKLGAQELKALRSGGIR